jgi:diguanylate cyclase (GGDEF)-like protein
MVGPTRSRTTPSRTRERHAALLADRRPLDDLPVAAVVVDRADAAVACNKAWTDLGGADTGQGWLDAIHPDSRDEAREAVAQAIQDPRVVTGEWRLAQPDGDRLRIAHARASRGADGNVVVALWELGSDECDAALRRRATHDPVTGLLNRDALADRARRALARIRSDSASLALLLVDLDDFGAVNERFGRGAGDRVLVAAAVALAAAVRPDDSIARIADDTFGVLCEATNGAEVATFARQLRDALSLTINFGDLSVDLSAKVVASYTRGADSFDTLLERADRALYFSKRTPRASSDGADDSIEAPATCDVRVLIVDDTHLVAEALMMSLQQHGFAHVALTRSVTQDGVLSAAENFGPVVALVDSELAGTATSLSLIRRLDGMGVAVVMLTRTDEPERSALCLEAGAVGIFDKSRAFEELMALLTDAALGRTVLQPARREALLEVVRSQREEAERRLAPFRSLTNREQRVLAALMDGKTAEVIAKEHNVSVATVRSQIRAVLQKLGVNSQLAAVALAIRADWEK